MTPGIPGVWKLVPAVSRGWMPPTAVQIICAFPVGSHMVRAQTSSAVMIPPRKQQAGTAAVRGAMARIATACQASLVSICISMILSQSEKPVSCCRGARVSATRLLKPSLGTAQWIYFLAWGMVVFQGRKVNLAGNRAGQLAPIRWVATLLHGSPAPARAVATVCATRMNRPAIAGWIVTAGMVAAPPPSKPPALLIAGFVAMQYASRGNCLAAARWIAFPSQEIIGVNWMSCGDILTIAAARMLPITQVCMRSAETGTTPGFFPPTQRQSPAAQRRLAVRVVPALLHWLPYPRSSPSVMAGKAG